MQSKGHIESIDERILKKYHKIKSGHYQVMIFGPINLKNAYNIQVLSKAFPYGKLDYFCFLVFYSRIIM